MSHQPSSVVQFQSASLQRGDGAPIVQDLDFQVHKSETLVLLGRSGSGKTTTLKLINRLLVPSRGQVLVEGRPTVEWEPNRLRRRIGYVIQEIGLFPHFSVERNVGLVPELEGWDQAKRSQRIQALLESVGLEPERFAGRYPSELSGGQRQRVGLARALAADPPLLLLDEPFGALDPLTRSELQRELKELQRRLAKTMVFVTHDVREALRLATRIGLFHEGRLTFIGSIEAFLGSDNPQVEAFVKVLQEDDAG